MFSKYEWVIIVGLSDSDSLILRIILNLGFLPRSGANLLTYSRTVIVNNYMIVITITHKNCSQLKDLQNIVIVRTH